MGEMKRAIARERKAWAEQMEEQTRMKSTVVIAADTSMSELRPLIRHLRGTGQLTAGLILRALLSCSFSVFQRNVFIFYP